MTDTAEATDRITDWCKVCGGHRSWSVHRNNHTFEPFDRQAVERHRQQRDYRGPIQVINPRDGQVAYPQGEVTATQIDPPSWTTDTHMIWYKTEPSWRPNVSSDLHSTLAIWVQPLA